MSVKLIPPGPFRTQGRRRANDLDVGFVGLLKRAVWFLFFGRVCPSCKDERTSHWGRYVTGVPFDEWICETCTAVKRIKFREFAARRLNP